MGESLVRQRCGCHFAQHVDEARHSMCALPAALLGGGQVRLPHRAVGVEVVGDPGIGQRAGRPQMRVALLVLLSDGREVTRLGHIDKVRPEMQHQGGFHVAAMNAETRTRDPRKFPPVCRNASSRF